MINHVHHNYVTYLDLHLYTAKKKAEGEGAEEGGSEAPEGGDAEHPEGEDEPQAPKTVGGSNVSDSMNTKVTLYGDDANNNISNIILIYKLVKQNSSVNWSMTFSYR